MNRVSDWVSEPRYDGPHVVEVTDAGVFRCRACGKQWPQPPTTEEYCPAPAPIREIYRMCEYLAAK